MRLIDADKYEGKVIASHCCSGVIKLVNIDDVLTAYDVDKVVEQLEETKAYMLYENMNADVKWIDAAIEIVKTGGNVKE